MRIGFKQDKKEEIPPAKAQYIGQQAGYQKDLLPGQRKGQPDQPPKRAQSHSDEQGAAAQTRAPPFRQIDSEGRIYTTG
jgi:hypothetical protein